MVQWISVATGKLAGSFFKNLQIATNCTVSGTKDNLLSEDRTPTKMEVVVWKTFVNGGSLTDLPHIGICVSYDDGGQEEVHFGNYETDYATTTGKGIIMDTHNGNYVQKSLDNRKAYVLDELYDSEVIKETIHNANMYMREANEIDKRLLREAVLDEHGEENIKDVYEGIGKFSEYDVINVNCLEFIKTILSGKSEKVNDFYDFSFYSFFRKG